MSFANIVTTIKPQELRKPKARPQLNVYDTGTAKDRMHASRHHTLPVEAKRTTGNSFMNR